MNSLKYIMTIPIGEKEFLQYSDREPKTESERQELALIVFANPQICYVVGHGLKQTYYTYDVVNRRFMYQKVYNKKRNGWYEARGMMSHLINYFKEVLPSHVLFACYSDLHI